MIPRTARRFLVVVAPALAASLMLALGLRWYLTFSRAPQSTEDLPSPADKGVSDLSRPPLQETPSALPRDKDTSGPDGGSRSWLKVEVPPGSGTAPAPFPANGTTQGFVSPPTTSAGKATSGSGSPAAAPSPASGENAAPGAKAVAEVWEKHKPKFAAMETIYSARVNLLLQRATMDYEKYKGSKARLLALAPRYLKMGLALEKEADAQFYAALDELAADLRANSLPTDLVSQLEKQYKEAKESRRKEVLDLARKALGLTFSWD